MDTWPLRTSTAPAGTDGLACRVAQIGDSHFASAALAGLQAARLRAASWSANQLWPGRTPVLHCAASLGVADTTRDVLTPTAWACTGRTAALTRWRRARPP